MGYIAAPPFSRLCGRRCPPALRRADEGAFRLVMTPHLPPLLELLADWQRRLRACRAALRDAGDHHPAGQLLRIHERVLNYLITRYQRADEPETPTVTVPLMQRRLPLAEYYWLTPPPPPVVPSTLHPPRSPAELRAHLCDIHTNLTAPLPRRTPWLLRWRPRERR
jgi:hypothetical protein